MGHPGADCCLGSSNSRKRVCRLSRYVLDTTVLIAHLRGDRAVQSLMLELLGRGHVLATTCVNVAELERGLHLRERRAATALLDRLDFLATTREAARRAGRYQADLQKQGRTLHTADALIAGTVRVHGAVLVTDNVRDFPMPDIAVQPPSHGGTA